MSATYRDLESLGHAIDTLKNLPPDGKRQLTADRLVEILVGEVERMYATFIGDVKWGLTPADGGAVVDAAPAPIVTQAAAPISNGAAAPSPAELVAGTIPADVGADLTWNGFAHMLSTHPSAGPAPAVMGSWLRSRSLQFDHATADQLLEMYKAMDDWYGQRDAQLQGGTVNPAGLPAPLPPRPAAGHAVAAGAVAAAVPVVAAAAAGHEAAMDVCPRCSGPTRTGISKFGEFHACNNSPECKGINGKGLIWSSANKWLTLWAQYHQTQ